MVWYNSIGASDVDDLIFGSDDQVIYSCLLYTSDAADE